VPLSARNKETRQAAQRRRTAPTSRCRHKKPWASVCLVAACCLLPVATFAETPETVRRFSAAEARQGVAVDAAHAYVIDNRAIGKYDKRSGKLVARWRDRDGGPLVHMNSGTVVGGRLYCAHSNYPAIPAASSIEIFSTDPLEHVDSHSFGLAPGSCTWVDRYNQCWWVLFAHYGGKRAVGGKDNRWTQLVRYDDQWRRTGGWVFPHGVLERFGTHSCSGGSWGPDGLLYCTGHDAAEVYVLRLPRAGSTLEHLTTLEIPMHGQAIAWDRTTRRTLYGVDRPKKQVLACHPNEVLAKKTP